MVPNMAVFLVQLIRTINILVPFSVFVVIVCLFVLSPGAYNDTEHMMWGQLR